MALVRWSNDGYAINLAAGVGLDIAAFETAADIGEACLRAGDVAAHSVEVGLHPYNAVEDLRRSG